MRPGEFAKPGVTGYMRVNMTAGEPALDRFLPGRLNRDGIRIHAPDDFEGMRVAGRLAADILDRVAPLVAPGVSTLELDTAVHDMMVAAGAISATSATRATATPPASRSTTSYATEFLRRSGCATATSSTSTLR